MIPIILSSFAIMLASLVGVISVWSKLGNIIEKNLHYLVSFSAGIFIIISYNLAYETVEHIGGYTMASVWIIVGIIISLIIFKLLPDFHHHHDNEHTDHSHSPIDARRIIVSDAIHNIGDGVLLAVSFGISTAIGITTTISIFIHEIVQETGEFFVLRQAGYNTKKALIINFIASGTILIGALCGYFLLDKFEIIEAPLLGITAGSFLIVVFHDLIPHSISSIKNNSHIAKHIAWAVLGMVIMILLGMVVGHQ